MLEFLNFLDLELLKWAGAAGAAGVSIGSGVVWFLQQRRIKKRNAAIGGLEVDVERLTWELHYAREREDQYREKAEQLESEVPAPEVLVLSNSQRQVWDEMVREMHALESRGQLDSDRAKILRQRLGHIYNKTKVDRVWEF